MKTVFILFLSLSLALAGEPDLLKFSSASRKFSSAVYNEILTDNKVTVGSLVSSFSLETILALTEAGAKDATATEIRKSLSLPETEEETQALMKKVLSTLKSDHYTLKTANKVYVDKEFAIKDDFKAVANDVYQAAVESVEFSAEEINKWVEEQTDNKIHDLISASDLLNVKVVLVNALYFQGNWSHPFHPQKTQKAKFFTSEEDSTDADLMYIESLEANYYESEELNAQILELPFEGEKATMTFILPNMEEGIALLEAQVDAVLFTPEFVKERVEIFLPKFKIESVIDFTLILPNLGVHKAFAAEEAVFSGISGEKGELFIDKILQKTIIDVNEIGVEAAAETAIAEPSSAVLPKTKSFVADHPFMFYIKVGDVILFEGRVLRPEY